MTSDDLLLAVLTDEATREERDRFRNRLEQDADLRHQWSAWQHVAEQVRSELKRALPDDRLLLLYVLHGAAPASLTASEREAIRAARPLIEEARSTHPGLDAALERAEEDANLFDQVWSEQEVMRVRAKPRMDRAPKRSVSLRRLGGRIAAGVGLVVLIGLALMLGRRSWLETTVTADGEMAIVELGGTMVRLAPDASLTYVRGEQPRRAELSGRAFFDVEPASEPFVVTTSAARATVIGTTFELVDEADGTTAVLASGELLLAPRQAPEQMVRLQPGEMSRVAPNALPTTPEPVELTERLAWSGRLFFHEVRLEEAVQRLEARFGGDVEVAQTLAGERITGTFAASDEMLPVLRSIAAALGARVELVAPDRFALEPAGE